MTRTRRPTLSLPVRLTVTVTGLAALHGCDDAPAVDASSMDRAVTEAAVVDVADAPDVVAVTDVADAPDATFDAPDATLDRTDVAEMDMGCPGIVLFCILDQAMDVPDAQCDTVTCYVNGCPEGCRSVG